MIRITCVVDNAAFADAQLQTEHGVAFWIETSQGTALFDTGQSKAALTQNLKKLGLDIAAVDAVALSHAHYDHTGGLEAVLSEKPNIKLYANAGIFRTKFSKHDNDFDASGFEFSRTHYEKGAQVHLNSRPMQIFPALWTSGEIINRSEPEGRSAGHYIRMSGEFVPDPYKDDMSLILKTKGGNVLICGCCHAGLLNTLAQVEDQFEGPVIAVIGGTHLMTADGELRAHVILVLKEKYQGLMMHLNHCTGEDALKALTAAFGGQVAHFTAGESVAFEE